MTLVEEIVFRYYEKLNSETSEIPIKIDHLRLKNEISYLLDFIKLLSSESNSLELIQSILDLEKAGLFKHSLTLLRETFLALQEHDLLEKHEFIYSLGVIISKSSETITLNEKNVNNIACKGYSSVDRKQPIMDYVYKYSQCPFCKQPVQTRDFIQVILDFNLERGGLTFKPINKGDPAFIHNL